MCILICISCGCGCSDVICEFPLSEMLAFHRQQQAEATILVTEVDDPSKFGVVVSNVEGRIERFVGKFKVSSIYQYTDRVACVLR